MSTTAVASDRLAITGRWDQLVWAINWDGQGQPESFDRGFRACLRALGVPDRDIAVLFGQADEVGTVATSIQE